MAARAVGGTGAATGIEYRVLGSLEVLRGGRSLALGGSKQRALLAVLLLNANQVVSRDRLIDELWGEDPPQTAVGSVQVYVSRLRKLLPADTLLTRPPGYVLAVAPGELDLSRFEELFADAHAAVARGDPTRASGSLTEALALWRGPALAEFVFEPFAQSEIGRLEDLRLSAIEERIEVDLALGRHVGVIGELEAVIVENPYRERLWGGLILALYRSGRQAEALEAYKRARRALVDDLGLEPGASLQRLEKQILAHDTAIDAPSRHESATSPARTRTRPTAPLPPLERKRVTVIFAALAMSNEAERDPEQSAAFLDRVNDEATAEIESAGGVVETGLVGALLATFGALAPQRDDHVVQAAGAALALRDRLVHVFEDTISLRMGVETGDVILGRPGSFVTGAPITAAAGLVRLAHPGDVVVSERVATEIAGVFELQARDGANILAGPHPSTGSRSRVAYERDGPGGEPRARPDRLPSAPASAWLGAHQLVRKTVTVLFCDVTGFTSLGERVDPETMRRVMLRYFDEMRTVLERHGGTVEKFIGDAVMAIFGVPVVHEDDALRAVRAADEMRRALERLNGELDRRFGVRLEERIGINTGEVVVGDPGTQQTVATGDAVNVAARLQQAAQPGEILLGRETHRLVADNVRSGPLETFSLKGKEEAVKSWRLDEVRAGAERLFRRLDSPLVGRTDELRVLHELYQSVVADEVCRLVTVVGPPGIGKTRFTQEVTDRLLVATVARGRCLSYGDGITFWPLADIVRTLAGITADDTSAAARERISKLVAREPDGELVAERVAGVIGLGGEARAEEGFWALRRLFEAVARQRPLVLVFEDVHWGDATALDFIEYLVGRSRGAPTLVVCLARPEFLDRRTAWPGPRIVLEPLDGADVRRLVANILGSGGMDDVLERRVEATADGNPLFVGELVHMLAEDGALVLADDRWTLADPSAEIALPPTISALLGARLDLLEPEERVVLQCASIVGTEFGWTAVTQLAPAELRRDVGTYLHALVRKRLIFPTEPDSFASEDLFRFGHVLVRDAAYQAIPKSRRADLHLRFADWIERNAGDGSTEWTEIAGYHVEHAVRTRAELSPLDRHTQAVAAHGGTLLHTAARQALARDNPAAAKKLLERALALLPAGADRIEAQLELVETYRETGDFVAADATLNEIDAASAPEGLAVRAALERMRLRQAVGPVPTDEVEALIERAVSAFELQHDEAGLAYAWVRMADVHWKRCRCAAMEDVLEQALVHADRAGARQEQKRIFSSLCRAALVGPRPVPDAIRRCEEVRVRAGDGLAPQATIAMMLAVLHAMIGSFDESRRLLAHSRTLWTDLGHLVHLAGLEVYSGWAELIAGEPELAANDLRRGYTALESMGEHAQLSTVAALLARAELFSGASDEAERLTRVSEEKAAVDDIVSQALWRGIRARIVVDEDEATAEMLARAAVEIADETDFLELQGDMLLDLADVLDRRGDTERSAAAAERAAERYAAKGDVVSASRARARATTRTP